MVTSYAKVAVCVSSAGFLSYLLYVYYKRNKKSPNLRKGVKQVCSKSINETATSSSNDGNILSKRDACLLTNLIAPSSGNEEILQRVLTTVANKAAFTQNQNILRDVGCLQRLTSLAKSYGVQVIAGGPVDRETLRCLLVAINNLAMNGENQTHFQDCIPSLLLVVNWHATSDRAVTLAALQALTNLSVTSSYHGLYADHVDVIVQLALSRSAAAAVEDVRLQSMKLLVNLTASRELVQCLLDTQNPSCFLQVLDELNNQALTLRALNVLVNLHTAIDSTTRLTGSVKPALENSDVGAMTADAPVPSSSSITGRLLSSREYLDRLRVKLDRLVRHEDQDIRTISLRLVSLLPSTG